MRATFAIWQFDWKRFILILVTGTAAGLAWNAASGRGFALGPSVLVQAGDELVEARDAALLLERGALFLDARPRDFWRMSRIPGSLPLPEDDFDRAFAEVEPRLRRARAIVVYCSGFGCEASHVVARRLREKGFDAAILDEGLPAWQDAGLPDRQRAPLVSGSCDTPGCTSCSVSLSAAFFVFASLDKIASPAAFARIVYQWQVIGPVLSNVVAVTLPWVELVAGAAADRGRLEARVGARDRAPARRLPRRRGLRAGPWHRRRELRLHLAGEDARPRRPGPRLDEGRRLVPRHAQPGDARRGRGARRLDAFPAPPPAAGGSERRGQGRAPSAPPAEESA